MTIIRRRAATALLILILAIAAGLALPRCEGKGSHPFTIPAATVQHVTLDAWYPVPRWHAYTWALSQKGCWYSWGGAGPCWRGFDCSGLVAAAYAHVGLWLPHNTVQMLYSGRLTRVASWALRPGDLAFFGTGHVEIYTGIWRWTLGAAHSGTRVGFHEWNAWWAPSAFYHVNGSR